MSTRKGEVVLLEEFMREAVKKAKEETKKRKKTKASDQLAKAIGYGAIKYPMLKISPEKNVLFDWEQALNFEGETAPYIQYAHARICSILRKYRGYGEKTRIKSRNIDANIDFSLLREKEEGALVKRLGEFPDIADNALANLRINTIAAYCYELAKSFNDFYEKHSVLNADAELKKARLLLICCVKEVLHTALGILGIEAPERM